MGYCTKCGKDDPKTIKFCVTCGNPVQLGSSSSSSSSSPAPVSPRDRSRTFNKMLRRNTSAAHIDAGEEKVPSPLFAFFPIGALQVVDPRIPPPIYRDAQLNLNPEQWSTPDKEGLLQKQGTSCGPAWLFLFSH